MPGLVLLAGPHNYVQYLLGYSRAHLAQLCGKDLLISSVDQRLSDAGPRGALMYQVRMCLPLCSSQLRLTPW